MYVATIKKKLKGIKKKEREEGERGQGARRGNKEEKGVEIGA